jgi:hypothetical protein
MVSLESDIHKAPRACDPLEPRSWQIPRRRVASGLFGFRTCMRSRWQVLTHAVRLWLCRGLLLTSSLAVSLVLFSLHLLFFFLFHFCFFFS